jgi:hypothetical protein
MNAYRGDFFDYQDRSSGYGEAALARGVMSQLAWGRPQPVMVDPRMYGGFQSYYPQPQYQQFPQYSQEAYYPQFHHHRRHHQPDYDRRSPSTQYFDDRYGDNYRYPNQRQFDNRFANRYDEYGVTSQYGRATYNNRGVYADGSHTMENARVVAATARRMGFTREQTVACLATMLVESRGDHRRIGDGGHSVGLFQLHDRGEGAGMSVAQRMNPALNAHIAMSEFTRHRYSGNPGVWAASAQRPADRFQFAYLVNSQMSTAHRLLAQCEQSSGVYA